MIGGIPNHAPLALRTVAAIDRVLTWGMEPQHRDDVLAEQLADWEAMAEDGETVSSWQLLARQIRGIPLAIWYRWSRREITSLPVAVALILIALANLAETAIPGYPLDHRLSLTVAATGALLAVWHLMRSPRRIVVANLRLPALLAGSGAFWSALTFPTEADWAGHGTEHVSTPTVDLIMQIGIFILVSGCVLIFAASFVERRRKVTMIGGSLVIAGAAIVGLSEVAWGLWVAPSSLYATGVALGVALGMALGIHMVLRLRNLEIA